MLCSKCVWQIERVQNTTLWQSYQLMKKQLEVKNKHTNNEKQLFHGTAADSIDLINHRGFNRSYAGKHGNKPTYQYQNQYPQSDTVLDYPAVLAQSRVTLNRTMVAVFGCEKKQGTKSNRSPNQDMKESVQEVNTLPTSHMCI